MTKKNLKLKQNEQLRLFCPANFCDGSGVRLAIMHDYDGTTYNKYFDCLACARNESN